MTTPSNPPPLPILAALTLGATALSPIIGAAISLAQWSWIPLSWGCVACVGLFVVYLTGCVVAAARQPRPEPEPHYPATGELRIIGDYLCEQVDSCTCNTGLINPVHGEDCGWQQVVPMDDIRPAIEAHRRWVTSFGVSAPLESGSEADTNPKSRSRSDPPSDRSREPISGPWLDPRSRRGDAS